MARVAIAGFYHETNTFSPHLTPFELFVVRDQWPPLSSGEAIFREFRGRGLNLAISGAIDEFDRLGHEVVPLTWAFAVPQGQVTQDAFERIANMIVGGLAKALPLDGVYLDMHGAMVAEHVADGTGEIIRRVRAVVGPDIPIATSIDLHSNTTAMCMEQSDAVVAFRTYPHLDMGETGTRAARILDRMLRTGARPAKAWRQLPFLIPLYLQCTLIEPSKGIYELARALETGGVWSVSFTPGFPPADVHHCGPMVFAVGDDQRAVDAAVDRMAQAVIDAESRYQVPVYGAADAVAVAIRKDNSNRPVVLADIQDNPGTGSTSDTVWLLEALVRQGAKDAFVGMIYDPEVADIAYTAGVGAEIEVALGAKSGLPGHTPFRGRFAVEVVTDGQCMATGPMFGGNLFEFGHTALLRIDGVRVMVSHGKIQIADKAMLRHVGIEPESQKILAIKSTVHFRNDFDDIAEETFYVAAPGINLANNEDYDYRNLRPGVRLMPMGRPHEPRSGTAAS